MLQLWHLIFGSSLGPLLAIATASPSVADRTTNYLGAAFLQNTKRVKMLRAAP